MRIQKVGIIGAGNMGSGIAQKVAQEGISVVLVDVEEKFVQNGLNNIKKTLSEAVERKILSEEQKKEVFNRISGTTNKDKLKELDTTNNRLKKYVTEHLIEFGEGYDDVSEYIKEILEHGCQSGIVGSLIYYKDTNEFYDTYEDEIEDLLEQYQDNCGYSNRMEAIANLNGASDVGNIMQEKNLLAWMGFEEMVREIADELEVEW